MSTINQAMIKAERERTGDVGPSQGIAPRLAGSESSSGITGARGAARPRNAISLEPMRKGIQPLQADSFEIEDQSAPGSVFAVRSWMLGVVGILAVTIGFLLAPGSGPGTHNDRPMPVASPDKAPLQEAIDPVRAVASASDGRHHANPTQYQEAPHMVNVAPDPIIVRVEIEPPSHRAATVMAGGQTMNYLADPQRTVRAPAAIDAEPLAPSSRRFQVRPEVQLARYRLEGIFWDEINPGAIINDRIVEEGDQIDTLRIKKILKSSVIVEIGGVEMELQ